MSSYSARPTHSRATAAVWQSLRREAGGAGVSKWPLTRQVHDASDPALLLFLAFVVRNARESTPVRTRVQQRRRALPPTQADLRPDASTYTGADDRRGGRCPRERAEGGDVSHPSRRRLYPADRGEEK